MQFLWFLDAKRRPFWAIFKLCATIFSFWVMNHDHVFRLWQSWQGSRPPFCWSFGWWSLDAIVSSGSLTSRTTTKPNFKRNWFIDWKVNFYIIINEKNPTFFCILDFHRSPLNFVTGTLRNNFPLTIPKIHFLYISAIRNRLQFLMGKVKNLDKSTKGSTGSTTNPTPRSHSTLNERYLFNMKNEKYSFNMKQRIDQLGRLWIIEFHLLSRWWFWGLKKLTIKWNMFKYTHQIWIFAIFAVIYARMETFWALFETLKKSGNFWAWK